MILPTFQPTFQPKFLAHDKKSCIKFNLLTQYGSKEAIKKFVFKDDPILGLFLKALTLS